MMTDYALAAATIAGFEGFEEDATWDVNAYRVGYGSDTEGPEQTRVTAKTTTTQARALANLQARIPEYEATIIHQVGAGAYNTLSQHARAALLSMAYNYGDLPASVAIAVHDFEPLLTVAATIRARSVDNKGVNAHRRIAEAAICLIPDTPTSAPLPPSASEGAGTARTVPAKPADQPEVIFELDTDKGLQQALNASMLPNAAKPKLALDGDLGPKTLDLLTEFCAARQLPMTAPYNEVRSYFVRLLSGL